MEEESKVILITDNLGRVLVGKYVGKSQDTTLIQDPFILQITYDKDQMNATPVPYSFHEFMNPEKRTGLVYRFSDHLFTYTLDAELTQGLLDLYNKAVAQAKPKPVEVREAKKVELFDNSDE